jgi:GT2 family glycosyltransferase
MAEQTNLSYAGRTLAVVLCMHRSGSSLVTNLFQRLGMSLGPFDLLGANEHNKYGHFEAVPSYRLDQQLLRKIFGFSEDLPDSPEVLDRFRACEGQWRWEPSLVSERQVERGKTFVEQLVATGPISGFKDPRVPLLWPFWNRVFADFPGLRVVPIFIVRSPHEIATSIFRRSKGEFGYYDALDVTAIHYQRLNSILDSWNGERAVVRFDPRVFTADLRRAAEVCRLDWNEEVFAQVYDPACKHHEPAAVAHPAERFFRRLSRLRTNERDPANLERLEKEAAVRESVMRSRFAEMHGEIQRLTLTVEQHPQQILQYQQQNAICQQENARYQQEHLEFRQRDAQYRQQVVQHEQDQEQLARYHEENLLLGQQNQQYQQENLQFRQADKQNREKIARLESQMALITGSRTWKLRQRLVAAMRHLPGLWNWRREVTQPANGQIGAEWSPVARAALPRESGGDQACLPLPKVTVVIVNYNGQEHIPACFESLFATDYPQFGVTLVDNGSSDGSVDWVRAHYPQVKIICNPRNVGFGRANQLGISESDAPVIALLNNDTVVEPSWLRALVEPLVADDHVAATSSKLRFLGNRHVLNGVGGGMNYLGFSYDVGMHEVDCGQRDGPREVLFPCGAACAIKRLAFEEAGGFDKDFFMYHEDVDLGWRLHLLGYSVQTAPKSVVYHRFGGTSRRAASTFFRERLGLRHDLRSLLKNYQWATLLRVLPHFMACLLKLTWATRSGRFLHCLGWNLLHLPGTLKERRIIQRCRRVSDRQLASLIVQQSRVPCYEPDYTPMDRETFLQGDCKKSWIALADRRWNVLGHGWYFVESYWGDPRVKYRWSQREAVVYLWNHFGHGTLELEVLGSATAAGRPSVLYVAVNDGPASRFELQTDAWETICLDLNGPAGPLEITIRVDETWSPEAIAHNGDDRQLGIGVKQIQVRPLAESPKTWDGISVIIPTYNRCQKLLKVLEALEAQTLDKRSFEVIVVDDGSTDTTRHRVAQYGETSQLRLRYVRQQNKLQGAARNYGIMLAQEPLLLFIGDDIIPTGDLLQQHLDFHRRYNPCGDVALVGRIQWSKDLQATPFMHFINDHGAQFGFAAMQHLGPWQFDCFYTSNISVPRQMLQKLGYVFDEDFKTYGWEDTELGYRLERNGMRLFYNAEALADHDHPTDLVRFCRRQYQVGMCSRVFLAKHPELEAYLGSASQMRRRVSLGILGGVLARIANLLDRHVRLQLPARWYWALLTTSYARGVVRGEAVFRPAACRSYQWRIAATPETSEAATPGKGLDDGRGVARQACAETPPEIMRSVPSDGDGRDKRFL